MLNSLLSKRKNRTRIKPRIKLDADFRMSLADLPPPPESYTLTLGVIKKAISLRENPQRTPATLSDSRRKIISLSKIVSLRSTASSVHVKHLKYQSQSSRSSSSETAPTQTVRRRIIHTLANKIVQKYRQLFGEFIFDQSQPTSVVSQIF